VLTADFSSCSTAAARRFMRGQRVPARCRGGGVQLFGALPPAPLSLRELRAAPGVSGARGRAINAVQLTVLDVTLESLSALFASSDFKLHGGGLRGGRWSVDLGGKGPFMRMRRIEYLPGVFVSGTVHGLGTRRELSTLRLSGPRTPDGTLRIGFKTITGVLGGRPVHSRVLGAAAAASAMGRAVDRHDLVRAVLRVAKRPRLR
jgi:hypothetical protein